MGELIAGTHTSSAAGQPPRRAPQTESGHAGLGPGGGGGQAGERGTRGPAGIIQGEHGSGQKHIRQSFSAL